MLGKVEAGVVQLLSMPFSIRALKRNSLRTLPPSVVCPLPSSHRPLFPASMLRHGGRCPPRALRGRNAGCCVGRGLQGVVLALGSEHN